MDRTELKKILIDIRVRDYKAPKDINPFGLALTMVDNIGDIDDELRDDLIFNNLAQWIVEDVITKEQTIKILNILLNENHLFKGIGERNDFVFTRTFSALQIFVIVYKHVRDDFLTKDDIDNIFNSITRYLDEEKDVRGFVEGKGWAHGVAHGADVLKELAMCEEMQNEGLIKMINNIKNRIMINYYVYTNEEDERMVNAILNIFERNIIDEDKIIKWIRDFENIEVVNKYPEDMNISVNTKNFLRSLYFRLLERSEYTNIVNQIKEVLKKISRFN